MAELVSSGSRMLYQWSVKDQWVLPGWGRGPGPARVHRGTVMVPGPVPVARRGPTKSRLGQALTGRQRRQAVSPSGSPSKLQDP